MAELDDITQALTRWVGQEVEIAISTAGEPAFAAFGGQLEEPKPMETHDGTTRALELSIKGAGYAIVDRDEFQSVEELDDTEGPRTEIRTRPEQAEILIAVSSLKE